MNSPVPSYGDTLRAVEIDDQEEMERKAMLSQREAMLRTTGKRIIHIKRDFFLIILSTVEFLFSIQGVIDLCYRELSNKPGTTANPIVSGNANKTISSNQQNVISNL